MKKQFWVDDYMAVSASYVKLGVREIAPFVFIN